MTTVQTVRGPVAVDDLGITLSHEHLLNDVSSWWRRSESHGLDPDEFADAPVSEALLWDLRQDPFGNRANLALDDVDMACAELGRFAALGGRTVVEATGWGIGRDLAGLRRISERTGVHVVAGTGFYLEASHPVDVVALGPDGVADRILADVRDGQEGVRPGIIGEIGVGSDFTAAEQVSLRGALAAQVECGLPIQVHLPGWFRLAGTVLDLAESEGADLSKLVLCHMGPSGEDLDYQRAVLDRGAWAQYDMLGMEVYYADQGVQCPSDEQNATHLARLVELGYGHRLLLSQDVFVKSLLRRHGGPGYAHILQYFAPRLRRHGLDEEQVLSLMTDNPRRLFGGGGHPTEGDTVTRILLAGESWISTATHVKGFDEFSSTTFHTGADAFIAAAASEGVEIEQMYAHDVPGSFPRTVEALSAYDAVILSDIGANSFVLPPEVWLEGRRVNNPLLALAEWTRGGGGLMMAGGYLSFTGFQARANFARTAVADVLPVTMLEADDRVEAPQGAPVALDVPDHAVAAGWAELAGSAPTLLGYNLVRPREDATVVATVGGDVLIATREVEEGRSLVWTSDIGPHWCPEDFLAWDGFAPLVGGMLRWLTAR